MTAQDLRQAAVTTLRSRLTGPVLTAGDSGYDEARTLFNAMVDKRPAVIAQCATVEDVSHAVRLGRDSGLEVAVRGGGHAVAGTALVDGGLVVDLRRMRSVRVDPGARTATAGGGATMRDLDTSAAAHGLATTGGRVSTTGVGGLTLGGGTGWLDRKLGLVCDNLLAAQVVTADGSVVEATPNEHPELFWALHGGGGNFGVVTSFTYRLHPQPTMTAVLLMWDPGRAEEVIGAYREFLASAPDEVAGAIKFHTAPDKPFVPPQLVGGLACTALLTYAGTGEPAQEATAPMRRLQPLAEVSWEVPYVELQHMLDDPPGYRNYWSAEYLDELPDEAVTAFCRRARDMVSPSPSEQLIVPLGGAVARGDHGFPVPWRRARWHVFPFGLWSDPADDGRVRAWARGLRADLSPWATGAVHLSFIGDEGPDRVRAGVGEENYGRLARVKARYDPENLFHHNHNIRPASGTP